MNPAVATDLGDRRTRASGSPPVARCPNGQRDRIERMLFARHERGDRRARAQLIERFLPLAHSVARRYADHGEPLDDLVQVACVGLVKAIDRFEVDRGYAFSSFAVPTIAGELKRHFRDRTWIVRPPRNLQELVLRIDQVSADLSAELDRAPTVRELAATLQTTDERILDALHARAGRHRVSMQASAADGGDTELTLQDVLGEDDDGYARAEDRAVLDDLLAYLPPRSQQVLRLRFEEDLTQAQIGELLDISQMQTSRIVSDAIRQLQQIAGQQERMLCKRAELSVARAR